MVASSKMAAAITRDPAGVATVATAEYLPWLLVTLFAGVWVDRWPKRSTMVVAALALCAAGMATWFGQPA